MTDTWLTWVDAQTNAYTRLFAKSTESGLVSSRTPVADLRDLLLAYFAEGQVACPSYAAASGDDARRQRLWCLGAAIESGYNSNRVDGVPLRHNILPALVDALRLHTKSPAQFRECLCTTLQGLIDRNELNIVWLGMRWQLLWDVLASLPDVLDEAMSRLVRGQGSPYDLEAMARLYDDVVPASIPRRIPRRCTVARTACMYYQAAHAGLFADLLVNLDRTNRLGNDVLRDRGTLKRLMDDIDADAPSELLPLIDVEMYKALEAGTTTGMEC